MGQGKRAPVIVFLNRTAVTNTLYITEKQHNAKENKQRCPSALHGPGQKGTGRCILKRAAVTNTARGNKMN